MTDACKVTAYVNTDDNHLFEIGDAEIDRVAFDATPYLERASDDQVREILEDCEGGYHNDAIYHDAEARGDADIAPVIAYLETSPTMGRKDDTVGFSVVVDEEELNQWVAENRPHLSNPPKLG